MSFALVFYPELRHPGLDAFRARYDSTAGVIREHLTVVFPVPGSLGRERLSRHFREVLARWRPFQLQLAGVEESWDHWLLLGVREGRAELVRLHDELYTDLLARQLRHDLAFEPHLGLGYFGGSAYDPLHPRARPVNEGAVRSARAQAEALALDFRRRLDHLTLVEVDDRLRWTRDLETLPLAAGLGPDAGASVETA